VPFGCGKSTPPDRKTLGEAGLRGTKSGAAGKFLLLYSRAKARLKGSSVSQPPAVFEAERWPKQQHGNQDADKSVRDAKTARLQDAKTGRRLNRCGKAIHGIAPCFWTPHVLRSSRAVARRSLRKVFSEWDPWTNCDLECGGGLTNRTRSRQPQTCPHPPIPAAKATHSSFVFYSVFFHVGRA